MKRKFVLSTSLITDDDSNENVTQHQWRARKNSLNETQQESNGGKKAGSNDESAMLLRNVSRAKSARAGGSGEKRKNESILMKRVKSPEAENSTQNKLDFLHKSREEDILGL